MKKTIQNEAGTFEISVQLNATSEVIDAYNPSTRKAEPKRVWLHTVTVLRNGQEWKRFNWNDYELKMHLAVLEGTIYHMGVNKRNELTPVSMAQQLNELGYK